jgi:DNA-binding GntR family transcriptional regulator
MSALERVKARIAVARGSAMSETEEADLRALVRVVEALQAMEACVRAGDFAGYSEKHDEVHAALRAATDGAP